MQSGAAATDAAKAAGAAAMDSAKDSAGKAADAAKDARLEIPAPESTSAPAMKSSDTMKK